jgi:hypothetical protein
VVELEEQDHGRRSMLRLVGLLDRDISNRGFWFPEVTQVEKPLETRKPFGRFPDTRVTKAMLYRAE